MRPRRSWGKGGGGVRRSHPSFRNGVPLYLRVSREVGYEERGHGLLARHAKKSGQDGGLDDFLSASRLERLIRLADSPYHLITIQPYSPSRST